MLFASIARADSFYPSGDTKYCEFAQAAAISYSSLPANGISGGLTYDAAGVKGVTLSWIRSTDFEDIGDVTFPDARRKNGIASVVWVPPNSTVNLDVYYYNFSGHSIHIEDAIYYTSLPSLAGGDLTRLGAPGVYQTNTFKYNGVNVSRSGKAHVIKDWKTVPANSYSNLPKGEQFVAFTTLQPIKLLERKITPEFRDGKLYLKYFTQIKNVSAYNLNNIRVEDTFIDGSKYTSTGNMSSGVTRTYEYENCLCDEYTHDLQIPRLKVSDPNFHIETAAVGTTDLFSYEPETRVFYTKRNDLGAPASWVGTQGDFTAVGSGDFIQIGLLSYDIHTDFKYLSLRPDIKTLPIISDADEHSSTGIITEADQTIKIIPEISNSAAFVEDLKVKVDFDTSLVEFTGQNAEYIDGDTVILTIPRLDNSETIRPELNFRPIDGLSPDEYEALFHIEVDGGQYYSFSNDLKATMIVPTATTGLNTDLIYSVPESQIDYIKGLSVPINQASLAKTGQFNFYFPVSFFIMAVIWLTNNWQQKLKRFKNQEE